jgi:hypothetical protein
MEVSDWIAGAALLVAIVTFFLAIGTFILNRRALRDERADRKKQIDLLRQGEAREASAHLVIENLRGRADNAEALFVFGVRNVGRATARNVRLEAEQPHVKDPASAWSVAETNLRAALAPDADERASLRVPAEAARNRELVLVGFWEDDNGVHQADLTWLHLTDDNE